MADFSSLKQTIQSYVKQNGNEEITGDILQDVLLAMVTTMGDGAINGLVTALQDEVNARQNADGILQGNITAEATLRQQADTTLGGRIDGLQTTVNAINAKLAEAYIYAGIATPSTNPGTPSGKVFYIALQAGTYTNFSSLAVTQGITILKYNGTAWSQEQLIGIDDEPTAGSMNIPTSGGVSKLFSDIIGVAEEKVVSVYETTAVKTGINLTNGIRYTIYVQCSTAVDNENTGVYIYASGSFTKIKRLTASEFANGAYFEYTPSVNADLYVRPYANGTVAVKLWDMTNYSNLHELDEKVEQLELFKNYSSLATIYDTITSESFRFSSIQYDSKGKVLSSTITWPDLGSGNMTIHYNSINPEIMDYVEYTKIGGNLGNTGTYRNTIVYEDDRVLGTVITKES